MVIERDTTGQGGEGRSGPPPPLSMADLVEGVGGHLVMPGEGPRHCEVGLSGEVGECLHYQARE
jgi:hypothetical protein